MGRSKTETRKRAKALQPLPKAVKPSPAQLVQNFDGRANTAAGKFERQADGEGQPKDRIVTWQK